MTAAPDPQAAWLTTPTGIGAAGTQHQFDCPARQPGFVAPGAVYGGPRADPSDGPAAYHEASSVCNAAVHAGRITHAAGGAVTIEMLGAQTEYEGSARNGVTSQSVSPADTASFGGIAFKVL